VAALIALRENRENRRRITVKRGVLRSIRAHPLLGAVKAPEDLSVSYQMRIM
jgi:hypothetical protein